MLCRPFLQQALSAAPDKQFNVQIFTKSGSALPTDFISRIVALMHADDFALPADPPDDLVVLLGVLVDAVALQYGLFITAAKSKIKVVGWPATCLHFSSLAKSCWPLIVSSTWGLSLRIVGRSVHTWMSERLEHWLHFVSSKMYGPAPC
eukprot:357442-Chlamydomonas_euryale.AAC.5